MSFPPAITHLETALGHAKAGNAVKAMHHIGHAMLQLRGMTAGAGGAGRLPSAAPMPKAMPQKVAAPAPAIGSLRAKLAGASNSGMNTSMNDVMGG